MKDDLCLSVCVPACNEEKTLRATIDDLLAVCLPHCRLDIIIVDDGSHDATGAIADEIVKGNSSVRVVHQRQNLGVGAAYRAALEIARGDYFTWFPADHENSASEFVQTLEHLGPNTAVTCHHYGCDTRSPARRMLSRTYTFILNTVLGNKLTYYNGLTVFPVAALKSRPMQSRGFFFAAEGLIIAMKSGCKVHELCFPLGQRSEGRSKALSLKSLFVLSRDFLKVLKGVRS